MIHRLDPSIPLVWRDPHTLQLGVDRVIRVFAEPSTGTERMLAALQTGAPLSALAVAASVDHARDPVADASALLAAVADALLPAAPRQVGTIVVDGDGPTVARLHRLLREAGHRVLGGAADAVDGEVAAIIVGSHVIPPWRHGPWLRRDIPHLAVVFGDDGARLGPFVDTDGPCLRCVSLARTEEDPAWPAIATQLDLRPPAAEPALLSARVAALAALWVDARVAAGDRSHAATSVHVHRDGRISERTHSPHAACGCRALPENVTALADRRHSLPSSAPAGASHA